MPERTDPNREVRCFPTEIRALEGGRASGSAGRLEGYAAIFDVLSEDLGGFRERIAPGAFGNALEGDDVRALFNHDPDNILGRNRSGTLRLREDERGLWFQVDVPEGPLGEQVLAAVRRKDIDQCSFSFTMPPNQAGEEWDEGPDGKMIRTLVEVARLWDVGPVTFPAYEDTVVSARAREIARAGGKGGPHADPRMRALLARHRAVGQELQELGLVPGPRDQRGHRRSGPLTLEEAQRMLEDIRSRWASRPGYRAHYRQVAIHEAGHAVIYVLEGVGVHDVEISGSGEQGVCRAARGQSITLRCTLGGIAAERQARFDTDLGVEDRNDALARLRELYRRDPPGPENLEWRINTVQATLREHWAAVEAIADALMLRGRLTGAEVLELVGDAGTQAIGEVSISREMQTQVS